MGRGLIEEREVFTCPFCGAPYRELIPANVTQVKCRYCGATVLVPPRLGGAIERCPNHPDALTVGVCNNCGKSYCDRCLHILKVTDQTYGQFAYSYVCPNCLQKINDKRMTNMTNSGIMFLFFGFFFLLLAGSAPAVAVFSCIIFWLLGIGFLSYGEYMKTHPGEMPETIHDKIERKEALRKIGADEIYNEILKSPEYWFKEALEKKIKEYMLSRGLSREEAIREIAHELGLPRFPPRLPSPEEIVAAERRAETHRKIERAAVILLGIIIVAGIAGAIYTHGEEIGTAQRNWGAIGSVSQGVHAMITPTDPRTMNETGLNKYFTDHGTSDSFVSIVVCGKDLAEIEYKGTTLQPLMKRIEVKVTFYTCSRSTLGANVLPTPHSETMTIFIGKLAPGKYQVTAQIYDGGAIAYSYRDGKYYKVFGSDSGGGGTDTYETTFTIS